MSLLITGASGYLGSGLQHYLEKKHDTIGTYNSNPQQKLLHVNITQPDDVYRAVSDARPDYIIHCSGLVDECSTNPDLAQAVNVEGTKHMLTAAGYIGAKLVYISSAAVFDGLKGSFSELDKPQPKSAYGQMKLEAETLVKQASDTLIIRPSLLVGHSPYGMQPRFFGKMMQAIKNNQPINLDNSWQFTPSYIEHIAKVIDWWIENKKSGEVNLLHIACPEATTKFHLAREISLSLGKQFSPIEPAVAASEPPATLLNVDSLKQLNAPFLSLEEVVNRIKNIEGNASRNKESLH